MKLDQCKIILFTVILSVILSGCATMSTEGLKATGDGVMQARSSPLTWQQVRSPIFTSPDDAIKYVDNLNLGGFTDWRLPTSEELLDLYFDFDFGGAKADKLGIKIEGNYWFKDENGFLKTGAWKDDGDICEITRGYRRSDSGYVRAVRP